MMHNEVFPTREQANQRALALAFEVFEDAGMRPPDPTRAPRRPDLPKASWYTATAFGVGFLLFLANWLIPDNWTATSSVAYVMVVPLVAIPVALGFVYLARILWLRRQRARARKQYENTL